MRNLQTFQSDGLPRLPEITWFQPLGFQPIGTENLAELDSSGRASRAYLFAGDERIGFRQYSQTALYVKDHLGSTKMTLALDDAVTPSTTSTDFAASGHFGQNAPATGYESIYLDPEAGDPLTKFDAQVVVEDTDGNHVYSQTGMKLVTTSDYLPVNTSGNWQLSGMLKTVNATDAKVYLGLIPYDKNKQYIHPMNVVRYGDPVTASNVTATQLTVTGDLTTWQPGNAKAYQRSIGIYYDGDTTKLPDYVHRYTPSGTTNSTNPIHGAYSQANGTTIDLNDPLPSDVSAQIVSGVTALMNHGSGDSYIYAGANNKWVPNTWTEYSMGLITGEPWGAGTNHFRKGTAYVKVAVLADWTNSGATVYMDKIHFRPILPEQEALYVSRTANPATKVTTPWPERILLTASDTGPYGLQFREIYGPQGDNTDEPHLFTGQEREPDLGLYYYGGRWQDPETGRFLQADPAREFWNAYSYVGNKPLNTIDPTGMYGIPSLNTLDASLSVAVTQIQHTGMMGGLMDLGVASQAVDPLAEVARPIKYLVNSTAEGINNYVDENGVETLRWMIEFGADTPGDAFELITGTTVTGQDGDRAAAAAALLLQGVNSRAVKDILRSTRKPNRTLRNKMKRIKNQLAAGGLRTVPGSVTIEESLELGLMFVGDNYRIREGKTPGSIFLLSRDGLRMWRSPTTKSGINNVTGEDYSKTGYQVNFQSRSKPNGRFSNNVHLDVKMR